MKSVDEKIMEVLAESAELAAETLTNGMVVEQIGSPIEKLMLYALWSRGVWRARMEFWDYAHGSISDEMLRRFARKAVVADKTFMFTSVLVQQMPVGPYRADFGIVAATSNDRSLVVAVECDGHDFHEKTKEQVAKDKARDRAFVERDIRVFRFSGAEIWRDAGECADQVLGFVGAWQYEPYGLYDPATRRTGDRA